MQKTLQIVSVSMLMILLVACGDSAKDKKGGLTDKKVKLEKLRGDQKKLNDQVAALEAEVAKEDPSVAANVAKLVTVMSLDKQNFSHNIELQGRIDAENISYVSPRGTPGQVKAVYVKEGDVVKKGQLLLKLDDAVTLQNLSQLETQLAYAKDIYQRQKNLWDQGIGTEVQFITAKNNVDAIEKQISTLKETWNLSFVRAEVGGVADMVNIHVGETFTGSPTQGIKIVNTSTLKIVANIPENYISRVKKGTPIEMVIPDLNNRVIKSNITLISQSIDPSSRGFQVEAKIPYDGSLKPNQVALMRILDYTAKDVIVVPVNVVQTDEKGKYVYVMEKNGDKMVARKKQVNVGESYNGMIEVKAGLSNSDQLITEGYQNLYEGQVIKVPANS